jgi:hypothetical protein
MRIRLNCASADLRAREMYEGASPPLTKTGQQGNPNTVEFWLTSQKSEEVRDQRHIPALRLYLELAGYSHELIREHQFPAVFELINGTRWPDKGVIKAALNHGLIITVPGSQEQGELLFELSPEACNRLWLR